MTSAARDIQRTRDPSKTIPQPAADDEVAELARTLQAMLDSLEAAQEETEGALQRQREFVADASHELRTPLTSILANLELLTDVLDGERGEAASSALRSSQRMRRLVGDLLLLARADANRQLPHEPTDVSRVLVEVAAELGPVSDGHHLTIDADDAVVDGTRDELYRMTLNLVENAIRHTPKGTHIRATVARDNGEVVLAVQDDGPGVAPELREHIFERFVRGAGDRGSSSGLGLSIVRAVAESHGGGVVLEDVDPGRPLRRAPARGRRPGARARAGRLAGCALSAGARGAAQRLLHHRGEADPRRRGRGGRPRRERRETVLWGCCPPNDARLRDEPGRPANAARQHRGRLAQRALEGHQVARDGQEAPPARGASPRSPRARRSGSPGGGTSRRGGP